MGLRLPAKNAPVFSNSRASSFEGASGFAVVVGARRLVRCRRRWSRRDGGRHPDNRRGPHRSVHRVSSSLSLPPRRWFRRRRRGARSDLRAVVRHAVGGGDPAAGEWFGGSNRDLPNDAQLCGFIDDVYSSFGVPPRLCG